MNIIEPTLVLNKTVCLQNIELMAEKARRHHMQFRPHFKTHQSIEIGRWFRNAGVQKITVSSLSMANYFASDGWNDITVAFPFNMHEIDRLNELSENNTINILADNRQVINAIEKQIKHKTGIFIKISTGYHRAGIVSNLVDKIEKLIWEIEKVPNLVFKGFLSHSGHTYLSKSRNEIQNIQIDAVLKLNRLKNHFIKRYPDLIVSMGDTPATSISEYFSGIDEIRPGNFIFNDLIQHQLGVCKIDDIAVRMYCPVVSKQQSRNEIIIYGGAVHFSQDRIMNDNGKPLFGRIILNTNGKKELLNNTNYVSKLSQEHGVIKVTSAIFEKIKIGDLLEIIPVHSCLTAYAMGKYLTTKGKIIETMKTVS